MQKRLIKVFASKRHPSRTLNRPITTVRQSGLPFAESEIYRYPGRGYWLPEEMEYYLDYHNLPPGLKEKARALFRFLHRPQLKIARYAMGIYNPDKKDMHYLHPLDLLDGLKEIKGGRRDFGLHLDIFRPESVERLSAFVDLNDRGRLVTPKECLTLEKTTPEGAPPTKESL